MASANGGMLTTWNKWDLHRMIVNLESVANSGISLSDDQKVWLDDARRRVVALEELEAAERRRIQEERQREAERAKRMREEAAARWREDPVHDATERGWLAMKRLVPNLDGAEQFHDLPDALQHRYGEFARAVVGLMPSADVVLSSKQVQGRTDLPGWVSELHGEWGCN